MVDVTEAFADVPDEKLGRLLKEYLAEANHAGWEGFTSAELDCCDRFLADVRLFIDNQEKAEKING